MGQPHPPAIAFARSPEYLMPPSAITGTFCFSPPHTHHDRGDCGHADARDDPWCSRSNPAYADLDGVRAHRWRLRTVAGRDVASDNLGILDSRLMRVTDRARLWNVRVPCATE